MKKQRSSLFGVVFAVLVLLVVFFLIRMTIQRPPEVILPELPLSEDSGGMISDAAQETIRRVEVTPETVQRVIEQLVRPESYSRTVTLERFWAGGSGRSSVSVAVSDGWSRADITAGESVVRHVINGDGRSWVWFDGTERVYSGAAVLSADEEESIPTYEDILLLPLDEIAAADYRMLEEVNCIYVETVEDEFGYTARYWVSVENGLLVAAERLSGEEIVYRMTGLDTDADADLSQAFTLPTGELLHLPSAEETDDNTTDG